MSNISKLVLILFLCVSAVPFSFAVQDNTPPTLNGFTFSPMQVDVTQQPAVVTVTAQISDDISGVAGAFAWFSSPSGNHTVLADLGMISGTILNGTWQGSATIPIYSESGTWTVSQVRVVDFAQNNRYYYTTDLQALGFPVDLQVTSNPDNTPPTLNGFTFSPMQVDVTQQPAVVTVTAQISDDISGVAGAFAWFSSPSGNHTVLADLGMISGTILNGTWQGSATIPIYSESGTWTVSQVRVVDFAQNNRYYYTTDLQALGFPVDLQVTSNPDNTPPTLNGFTFSPMQVDVTQQPAVVTVTAQISDDISGVAGAFAWFSSPSGNHTVLADLGMISGTILNGTWQGSATIPIYSESGTWTVSQVRVVDFAQNNRYYYTTDLQALGFPVDLQVIDGTAVTLVSSINPSVYNQPVNLTATVSGSGAPPTGTVNFYDGSALIGSVALNASGIAILTTSVLAPGAHEVVAAYTGDENDPPGNSSPLSQVVNQATSSTAVSSSANPTMIGVSGTLTALVSGQFGGTPTGTVTFKVGSFILGTRTLNSGKAKLQWVPGSAGKFSIIATYSGDTDYSSDTSGSFLQVVLRVPTTTDLSSSLNPSTRGEPVTLTASVNSSIGIPMGGELVAFTDGRILIGDAILKDGQASFTTSTLSVGTHNIRAEYVGDSKRRPSISAPVVQVVLPTNGQ